MRARRVSAACARRQNRFASSRYRCAKTVSPRISCHAALRSASRAANAWREAVARFAAARRALGVPVRLHRDDLFLYEDAVQHGLLFGIEVEQQPPIDRFYDAGETIPFGDFEIRVHHTPGHCPGGVCLAIAPGRESDGADTLFVGDTLFAGSIGRTDLPGGDYETLLTELGIGFDEDGTEFWGIPFEE